VSPTAANAEGQQASGRAAKLGIAPGNLVQSLNEDDDIALDLLDEIKALTGNDLVPEDSDDVVDVVLLWFRDDDGDLVDALVDARRQLSDEGQLWLLTPKSGRPGHVEPSDILESVPTAGLVQTSTVTAGQEWTGMRLAAPRGGGKRQR
jgi:Protein of unknown function (DUF3052)